MNALHPSLQAVLDRHLTQMQEEPQMQAHEGLPEGVELETDAYSAPSLACYRCDPPRYVTLGYVDTAEIAVHFEEVHHAH